MKNQFADDETSRLLRVIGFNEPCFKYDDSFTANTCKNSDFQRYVTYPTWQQAKQWLWDNHEIHINAPFIKKYPSDNFFVGVTRMGMGILEEDFWSDSPITAEIQGIKKAVEYLYAQKNDGVPARESKEITNEEQLKELQKDYAKRVVTMKNNAEEFAHEKEYVKAHDCKTMGEIYSICARDINNIFSGKKLFTQISK